MNGKLSFEEQEINQEVKTNQVLLLKEKLQNLQNIHLRKKLSFKKENLEKNKKENDLNQE